MRLLPRFAALTTAAVLALSALAGIGSAADAAPPVTLTGSAAAIVTGPGTVTFSYTIELPYAVDHASFQTRQAAQLPALADAVTLDGAPVPPAQITQPSSIDIAVQTGPTAADGLPAGTHTIGFTASINGTDSVDTSSTATFSFSVAGAPESVTATAVAVSVNPPDLSVIPTPDSGEDQVGFLGTGRHLSLAVDVTNLGYGSPTSTLTVTLPAGMKLGTDGVSRDADNSALTCAPAPGNAQQLSCALGALPRSSAGADPTLLIDLTTTPGEPIGSTVPVTVSVSPNPGQGTDTEPANNSATVHVQYTGSAKLSYTLTPASKQVVVGKKTTVTLTVHNSGPQPAPATVAFAIVVGDQFSIGDFSGQSISIGGGGIGGALASNQARALAGVRLIAGAPGPAGPGGSTSGSSESGLLWLVGDIPSGGSVSAVLTLQARSAGAAQVGMLAVSGAADPNCPNFDCSPTTTTVTAITAPVHTPAPTPETTPPTTAVAVSSPVATAAGPTLAATGASTRPAVLGGGLLIIGAALLLLGRRRPRTSRA